MLEKKEEMFELYLKLIGEQYAANICQEIDDNKKAIEDIEYPPELDEWFYKFNKKHFRKQRFNERMKKIHKVSTRVAAALIVTVLLLSLVTFGVEAFRIEFLNFFMNQKDDSLHISSEILEPEETAFDRYSELFLLDYVPDGYVIDNIMVNDKDITMIYVKQEDNLVFIQYKNGIDINIDNERAKITTYTLETGEDAIIAENDDFTTIIWKSGVYTLFIEGNTDRSSIIKMAESSFFKK